MKNQFEKDGFCFSKVVMVDGGPGQGEAVVTRKLKRDVPLEIPEDPKPPEISLNH